MHFCHKTAVYHILKEITKQVFQDDIQSQILYGYAEPLPKTETGDLQENKFSASDIRDRPEEERAKITKALEKEKEQALCPQRIYYPETPSCLGKNKKRILRTMKEKPPSLTYTLQPSDQELLHQNGATPTPNRYTQNEKV